MPLRVIGSPGGVWGSCWSEGCGVDAVDFSLILFGVLEVKSRSVVGVFASREGDRDIRRLLCSILRRQLATISSPNMLPKVSTFWKGRGKDAGGDKGESASVDGGFATPGKEETNQITLGELGSSKGSCWFPTAKKKWMGSHKKSTVSIVSCGILGI